MLNFLPKTHTQTRAHTCTSTSSIESYIYTYLHASLCSYYVPGTELGTEIVGSANGNTSQRLFSRVSYATLYIFVWNCL